MRRRPLDSLLASLPLAALAATGCGSAPKEDSKTGAAAGASATDDTHASGCAGGGGSCGGAECSASSYGPNGEGDTSASPGSDPFGGTPARDDDDTER
jgi:hypothetical protein